MPGLLRKPTRSGQPGMQAEMPPQESAMQGAPVQQGMPAQAAGMQPGMEMGGEEVEADESHPAYQAALQFVEEALYGQGAATQVADSLARQGGGIEALANVAYDMVVVVDEKTEGAVPDELLASLAAEVLSEVVEVAQTAGVEVTPADAAEAMKHMILRFASEQGADITELEAAMNQVPGETIQELAMADDQGAAQQGQSPQMTGV